MASSLASVVSSPIYTKAAILLALKSVVGQNTVWVVVEAEDDYRVYKEFMDSKTTVVKTSEDVSGRKSYANVESIVADIKNEVPAAHILGIRDADYTKYEDTTHVFPVNIFPTDRRDLEMMILESEKVQNALRAWAPAYDAALVIITPVCRQLGYLRIYNEAFGLMCMFRNLIRAQLFWEFSTQSLKTNWKFNLNAGFFKNTGCKPIRPCLNEFIKAKALRTESFYDVCRGHDLINILSLALVNNSLYKPENIMMKMREAYTLEEFKKTKLYTSILSWQTNEGVTALIA